jgi:HD superfamily phosphohydrolase YqeK
MNKITIWFDNYVNSFADDEDKTFCPLKLKTEHSRIVAKEIVDIANSIGFTKHDLLIAECIGLLHDIGRFEQYKKYRTFKDRDSENHAHIALKVLKSTTVLDGFEPAEKTMILRAIEFHNVKQIPDNLTPKEKVFAQLIRDADKIDIFRIVIDYYRNMHKLRNEALDLGLPDAPGFTECIIQDSLNGKTADYNMMKTLNDFKVLQLGWVYDISFTRSFEIISERKFLDDIYNYLPKTKQVNIIYENAKTRVKNGIETL